MTQRICVIHIGTHKTGTTLLQHFLQWNAGALGRAGICFPQSAWYGVVPGQHAAAWELYDEGVGTETAALFAELCANEARHAIVSSEEFSLLYDRPLALRSLMELISRAGYEPRVLAYVRAQPPLAESMYAERIKHKEVQLLHDFMDGLLRTGSITAHSRRVTFRLSELLSPFKHLVGRENIHLRPYPVGSDPLSLVHDFLEALHAFVPEFVPATLNLTMHRTKMNESLTFGHLLGNAFLALFPQVGLPDDPQQFIEKYVPSLPRELFETRFSLLEREDHLRFLDAFAGDNNRVLAEYGATAPFLTERDIPPAGDPRWAVAAYERPLLDACLQKWIEESKEVVQG